MENRYRLFADRSLNIYCVSEEKSKMRGVGVVVEVTMQFLVEPTDAEKNGMIESAMKLTKNPVSVIVEKNQEISKDSVRDISNEKRGGV